MADALTDPVAVARELADDVLFPAALEVDRSGTVPVAQLDRLADTGLYGLFSPAEIGGLGAGESDIELVREILAGGCLTTSFIWNQHAGPAKTSAVCGGPVQERWSLPLASGSARGGVAFAHLLRPGEPVMTAEPDSAGGYRFSGHAPFVTGWGHIDVVLTAARLGEDVVWAMLDASESASLTARRLELAAVDSSVTVELRYDRHVVPAECVTHVEPYSVWLGKYHAGLRGNGSLPLGVAGRALDLLGPSALDDELVAIRADLDAASGEEMPAARSRAALFAVRATSALVVSTGGRAVFHDQHAQRLAREAMFLLVQGQTAEIRQHNLRGLAPR